MPKFGDFCRQLSITVRLHLGNGSEVTKDHARGFIKKLGYPEVSAERTLEVYLCRRRSDT